MVGLTGQIAACSQKTARLRDAVVLGGVEYDL